MMYIEMTTFYFNYEGALNAFYVKNSEVYF